MKTSRTKFWVAFVAILALLGVGLFGSVTAQAAAPTGTQIVFRDDFSGSGLPDPDKWLLTTGTSYPGGPANFGTGEIQTMTNRPENVDVRNGNLYITPQRDAAGAWTSARVESQRSDFKPPAGGVMHVESRLQMPNVTGAEAQGYWPAFWMLGGPYRNDRWSWPAIGEFDIMENVQGLNWTYNVLHCGVWAQAPCNEPEGINNGRPDFSGEPCRVTTCQAGFHTYGLEWDNSGTVDELRWYLDGVLTFTVKETDVTPAIWTNLSQHAGYFIILNVSIGGAFPNKLGGGNGGPFATTKPGVPMVVDYVEVAYRGGDSVSPTSSATPTTSSSTVVPTTANPTVPTSASATATASPTFAAGTPSNLHLKSQTSNSATLEWDGAANASYDILRGEGGVRIATVTGNTFKDEGLNLNTPYVYAVRGTGGTTPQLAVTLGTTPTTSSSASSPTTASTTPTSTTTSAPATGSATPSALAVASKTSNSVTLSWSGNGAATYDILRGEDGVRIATVSSGTTFTDGGLNRNTPYVYSVRGSGTTTPQITVTTAG